MAKPARIYTRSGDDGTTGLVGGERRRKDDRRIEAYGTLDELSSAIGVARAALAEVQRTRTVQDLARAQHAAQRLDAWLAWTQDVLFNLGSQLATPGGGGPSVLAEDVAALERGIDAAQGDLPPLTAFIHPGGAPAGASLHLARTIARRSERAVIALGAQEPLPAEPVHYLNRLSDALFVWARWINHALDQPEHRWDPAARPPAD